MSTATETDRDPRTLPLLRTETRKIATPITGEEAKSIADEIDDLYSSISRLRAALKEFTSETKDNITGHEKRQYELDTRICNGIPVEVKCEVRLDEARGTRIVLRTDTGEVLAEEPTDEGDREPMLPLGDDEPAIDDAYYTDEADPTDENDPDDEGSLFLDENGEED